MSSTLPPLVPRVDAILVLDGDGNRIAGKYYNAFLHSTNTKEKTSSDLRSQFERQLHSKINGIAARPDAAEVVTVGDKTAVFCGGSATQGAAQGSGGGDVRVVVVGPQGESELVLAHFAEGMFDALSSLMGGATDRTMLLDNLELVLLLIDEHCDGGIVLETDGHKLVSSVLLRDDDGAGTAEQGMPTPGLMMPGGINPGEMTIGQALRQAREQLIAQMGQRSDGM